MTQRSTVRRQGGEGGRDCVAVRHRRGTADASGGFRSSGRGCARWVFFITLQTNASLIRGNMAELLEEYPPRIAKVTLYGSDNDIYRDVCGVENGFTRVDEGYRLLKSCRYRVEMVSTVIRQNQDDVRNMAFYAFTHKNPVDGSGRDQDSCRGADSRARSVRVEDKLDEQKRKEIRYRLEKAPVDIERKPCTYCKDYRLGYWVTWNGRMRFCSFMNEPDIDIRRQPFSRSWEELARL